MTSSVSRIVMDGVAAFGTWPVFGILTLLSALLFGYLVPRAKAAVFSHAGAELPHKVLDEYFPSWTPQIADQFFASIGPEGRVAYRRFYLTVDFWFPGAMASLAIASLMLIAFPPASGWGWLSLIAAPSWLFDVAENITHFRMARSYPDISSAAFRFGPLFTGAKWVSAVAPLPIALAGLLLQLFQTR